MTGIALQPCPAGTFNPSTGLSQESQCTNCTGGFYCSVTNLTAESGPCDAGYYCRSGSDDPTPTPASTGDAGPCPEGYYCEQQTQDPVPCPAGTFNNRTMLTNVSECQDCTPGYYCEVPGLSAPTNLCDAGFYCSGASDSASPPAVTATGGPCPVGKYCEVGTSVPQDCPAGTFTDVEKQSICQNCSMGYYCTAGSSSQVICPKGRFLTLFRPMEFSIKLQTFRSGQSIEYIEGSQVIISKNIVFLSLKIVFFFFCLSKQCILW